MKQHFLLLLLASFPCLLFSQPLTERYNHLGTMFLVPSTHSMFPSAARDTAHWYDGKRYSAEEHYRDSSVALFVPKGFKPGKSTNFVVYVHGWNNNIDSACAQFRLIEQFAESNRNAVFVFPEGPKNSSDSFGGKLEDENQFKQLMEEVAGFLRTKKIAASSSIGNIVLAGHSGAYRVMSFILLRGGLTEKISGVILFDALYGQTEKFAHWIEHAKGRLIDIYTENGGTKRESEYLMDDLKAWKIPFLSKKETELAPNDLRSSRLVFIYTDLEHNDVIAKRNQFREYLRASGLK